MYPRLPDSLRTGLGDFNRTWELKYVISCQIPKMVGLIPEFSTQFNALWGASLVSKFLNHQYFLPKPWPKRDDFVLLWAKIPSSPIPIHWSEWSPPPQSWIEVNFDASFAMDVTAIASIACDEYGQVVWGEVQYGGPHILLQKQKQHECRSYGFLKRTDLFLMEMPNWWVKLSSNPSLVG